MHRQARLDSNKRRRRRRVLSVVRDMGVEICALAQVAVQFGEFKSRRVLNKVPEPKCVAFETVTC
jgi:hypothetical protein